MPTNINVYTGDLEFKGVDYIKDMERDPTSMDYVGYHIPTVWVNKNTGRSFLLVLKVNGVATWIELVSAGIDFYNSVLAFADSTAVPPTTGTGDRYILDQTAGAVNPAWDGAAKNDIVEYDGTQWHATTPTHGGICYVEDEGKLYVFDGAEWKSLSSAIPLMTTTIQGIGELCTNAEVIAGTLTDYHVVNPSSLKAKLGDQTDHGLLVGSGDDATITALAVGTNGQVCLGSIGADPIFSDLTSGGNTIEYIGIPGGLNLDVTDATTSQKGASELATDAESIAGTLTDYHVINPSSLKAKLGTQTDHGLLVGSGTNAAVTALAEGATGTLLVATTGADPAWRSTSYGDFSFTNLAAATTSRQLSVINLVTDATSHADLRLSTPPLGGDSLVSWEVQGSHFFAAGVDNQAVGDPWKLSNSSHPSVGTAALAVDHATAAVTFADTYEFPIADGNVGEVLTTDGAGNVDWGGVHPLLPDLDNILFVGKHGNDANDGKTPFAAKLTIQAAVTAAAVGDTIIVYPGSYNETVTHAANNLTMIAEGKTNTVIITQADANVVDFATFRGIQYKYFGISCTAATTAINTVQGSTGSCIFKECNLEMTCATDIAAAIQPAVGSITGNLGELKVTIGRVTYAHTGNGGGTAQKGAFMVANGASVTLQRINDLSIANSGTALVTGVGIDTASTGVFFMNDNKITVTDPNAVIVTGLAYLGGTGLTHEYFRNTVHVVATNNIGYGFFSADTVTTSRFFYNHIHVTDVAGSSYSYLIGNGATVISHFDDIIADDGHSLVAGGTFTEVNSETDGNLSVTNLTQHAPVIGGGSSALTPLGPLTNGQLVVGSTGAAPVAAALTSTGGTINVTLGAGTINLEAGGGFNIVTTTTDAVAGAINTMYIIKNATPANLTTLTLPDTAPVGSAIQILGYTSGCFLIAQNAGEQIFFGDQSTTVGAGGSIASTGDHDVIELVCVTENVEWQVIDSISNGFAIV